MIEVKLEKSELMALDGTVNAEAQSVIDKLKRIDLVAGEMNLPDNESQFVCDVIEAMKRTRLLLRRPCRVSRCRICGRGQTPILYKSGRNRGKVKGYISGPGYDLVESFTRMDGYPSVGACCDCVNRLMPVIIDAIAGIEVEIQVPGFCTSFKRQKNRICKKCGWTGHEGEMKKERTMMGDGWYPAGCPNCPARNGLGFTEVDLADGYTMVPFTAPSQRLP